MKLFGLSLIFLQLCYKLTEAQMPWPGPCPELPAVSDFDVAKYSGTWYEAQKYFFVPELTGNCNSMTLIEEKDGTFKTLIRSKESLTAFNSIFDGKTYVMDPEKKKADMVLFLNIVNPVTGTTVSQRYTYQVVATDYDRYAIQFSCMSLNLLHFKSVWVLTRDPNYPEDVRRDVYAKLDQLGINKDILMRSDQSCSAQSQKP